MTDNQESTPSSLNENLRRNLFTLVKWLMIVVAVVFLGRELSHQWQSVRAVLSSTNPWGLGAGIVLAMAAVVCAGEQQRSLLHAFGHDVPLRRWQAVFLGAQLGKYVPGTAWAYVSQMELSRKYGIGRRTSVIVIITGAATTLLASFAFGGFAINVDGPTWLPPWIRITSAVGAILLLCLVGLRPHVLTFLLGKLPRRFGFGSETLADAPSLWPMIAYTAAGSALYGFHLFALAFGTGPINGNLLLTAIGSFSLAWAFGFLAFFVPAGVGVREAVLAAFLVPQLTEGRAFAIILLSRFTIIVAESLLVLAVPVLRARPSKRAPDRVREP